jgi:hypothetical protein
LSTKPFASSSVANSTNTEPLKSLEPGLFRRRTLFTCSTRQKQSVSDRQKLLLRKGRDVQAKTYQLLDNLAIRKMPKEFNNNLAMQPQSKPDFRGLPTNNQTFLSASKPLEATTFTSS